MRSGQGCHKGASCFSFLRLLLVVCIFLAASFSNKIFATHAAGADLTYRCLGGLVYEIDATFYRDCNGSSEPGNLTITYKSASCGQTRTVLANKVVGDNGNEITMPCANAPSTCNGGNSPGLRKWVYRATVTLPSACTDWVFSYRVCCRNCTITTIQSPCAAGSELYVEAKLDNVNAPGNSSPHFGNMPVAFVCLGQNFNYNQYVYDLDGDSIAYELITPKTSATGEVTFLPPYSTQSPMASSTPFSFNTITGDLNFTPSQLQIGVIAIRANEYRNGILAGSTIRDIQVYTQSCFNTLPTATGINGTSTFSVNACAGQQLCFNIQTIDADSLQQVNVNHNSLIQGATISVGNGPRPQVQFCWTPQAGDVRTAPYQFTITVFDNACPYNGMQTYLYSVYVNGPALTLSTQDPQCFGAANGTATVAVNPPSGNTIVWNTTPPQNGFTATGLVAGTYTATVTDINGCMNTATAVLQNPPSNINLNCVVSGAISCQSGNAGAIQVNASGGLTPYSYSWSNGAQSQIVSGLGPGVYTVTVTDANGCTMSASATVNAPQGLMSVSTIGNAPLCYGGTNGSVSVTLSGGMGPYSYLWSNGSTATQLTNVTPGIYTVTVTDNNNCTVSASATVNQPPMMNVAVVTANDLHCAGDSNGSLMAQPSGGNGNFSYLWNSGSTQNPATGLSAGNYSVTVTDQAGCTATANFTLHQPQPLQFRNVVVQQPACPGTTGSISFTASGGTAPYQFSWQSGQTGNAINGLVAGLYTCTITDHNGCNTDTTFEITENANPLTLLTPSIHHVDCSQQNSGSVSVQLTGGALPYSYQWSNGGSSQGISGLSAGIYTVTVTDHNGCSAFASYTINGGAQPFHAQVQNFGNVLCFNGNNGFIDLELTGTNTPYQYQWSNGSISQDLTQLTGGTYTVVITDGSGCDTTLSFSISQPAQPLIPSLSVINSDCHHPGGSIAVVATGGTAPYSFLWSNGEHTSDLQNVAPGYYMVTVTDANGCNAMLGDSVRGPSSSVQVSCSVDNNQGCDASLPVTIHATADGGNGPYTFLWNTGAVTSSVTVNSNGIYSVVVTDATGCSSSATANVTAINNPVQVAGIAQASVCLTGQPGQIALNVYGGHTPYSYVWDNGSNSANPGPLTPGVYQVVVTDANGCTATNTFTIDDQSALLMNNQGPVIICTGETTTLTVGIYPGVTYQWYYGGAPLNGAVSNQFTTPAPGFYYVTASGPCGTFQSNTMEVIVKSVGNVSISNNQIICPPESVQLFASGGVSYEWSPAIAIDQIDVSDPVVNPVTTTSYTVTITNAEGCKSNLTVMVGVMCDSLFIPNGFSPNGDGTNDGYVIDGIEKYPDNKLWIYNRWGNLVYKAKNYDNHWNGISNISGSGMGNKVQPGTYYYILDLNDGSKPRSGFLVIRH
jgi:gliding motility-associated-like protein